MSVSIPRKDAELLAFSANVKTRVMASGNVYQLSDALVDSYITAQEAFAARYQAAFDPITRTRAAVVEKNESRIALGNILRSLCGMVQANDAVPEAAKVNLGLAPRKPRKPAQVPGKATVDIEGVELTNVTARAHGGESSGRARPPYVDGVTWMTYVGEVAPADPAAWSFAQSTSKLTAVIPFSPELPFGTKVWVTAFFFNSVKESGIAANPVSVRLTGNNVTAQAA
jgi:hypothetical protein